MAQTAVRGPFHERDLCHELGLDPGCGARNALLGLERGRFAHERGEPLGELAQRRAGKAGPDLAGVAQSVGLEVADEQSAEVGARAARRGEAPDHELLRARALELQPVARARGHVRRAEALGDQSLPAVSARVGEQRCAVAGELLGHAQWVAPAQHAIEYGSPFFERERPHVAAVCDQHVEDVVEELAVRAATEPVTAADERNRLTVDHEAVGRDRVQCGGQRRVAVVQRQLVARVQPRASAVLDRQAADTVELALEHPLRARRPLRGQHRLHRHHEHRSHVGTAITIRR